jgi:hypothetical protein
MERSLSDEGYRLHYGPEARAIVRATLDRAVRPHLQDVRAMLRLPLPEAGITAGCNFAAVHVLLNVLSGLSRLMESGPINSGKAFKTFAEKRYPWKLEPLASTYRRKRGTAVLYDYFRNGFSHDLGLLLESEGPDAKGHVRARFSTASMSLGVMKTASLPPRTLVELDEVERRPPWLGPTVFREQSGTLFVDAVALYWGVRRLIFDHTSKPRLIRSFEKMLQERRRR